MTMNCKFLAASAIVLFLSACTKEKIVEKEVIKEVLVDKPAAANISITSPKTDEVYNHGDTVHIKGLLTGVQTLHSYEISVRNADMHDHVLFLASVHAHDKAINVDTFWVNNQHAAANLTVNITTNLDHDGNSIGKKVAFKTE